MLVRRDFYNAYKEIQADAASGGPIYIFVSAADCDSCCAFRILKTLLESDNISYVVYAVAGFADLQKRGEALLEPPLPRLPLRMESEPMPT